jgi:DinB superfamily
VRAQEAAWRPGPGRHNIWELTVHAAYWKYAAWRHLTGTPRGSFALGGSNWFDCPSPLTEPAWKEAVALLLAEHRRLREAVAGLSGSALAKTPKGSRNTHVRVIRGIAAHDLYHAGQIQLLKRLVAR